MIATAVQILAGLLLAGWLYWLTYRQQQILNRADRQQDVIDRRLALVPSKSAPRTEAPEVLEPWVPFPRLTAPVAVAPRTEPDDVGMDLLDQPAKRRHAAPKGK